MAGAITSCHIHHEAKGEEFGKAFEHFICMELIAHRAYTELDYRIHFCRTKSGLEVDFVLGNGQVALEVKGSSRIHPRDIKPIKSFTEEFQPQKAIIVCNEPQERIHGPIRIMPYTAFLSKLWNGDIIS